MLADRITGADVVLVDFEESILSADFKFFLSIILPLWSML